MNSKDDKNEFHVQFLENKLDWESQIKLKGLAQKLLRKYFQGLEQKWKKMNRRYKIIQIYNLIQFEKNIIH